MKRLIILTIACLVAVAAMAQTAKRVGVYNDNGKVCFSQPTSSVTVVLDVERRTFTPGELARYAQKYLGVRASLAPRTECKLLSASIVTDASALKEPSAQAVATSEGVSPLPAYRTDGRAMTQEQQASAAAEMIFSLRRHRTELITGDAGEYVFGAGLQSALDEISRLEAELLALFYGTERTERVERRFEITPISTEKDYVLCRYRDDEGVVSTSDLSGEIVMLHIEPQPTDVSYVPLADEKAKTTHTYIIPASCHSVLLCGTREIAAATLTLYQYGTRVEILPVK